MSDPLFGTLLLDDASALFGGGSEAFAPANPLDEAGDAGTALGLDPAMACGVLPWHGGAFALALPDLPAGALAVTGPRGPMAILAQTRLLRADGHTTLVVVEGTAEGALVLSVDGDGGITRRPLRPSPATVDRTLATLVGQALARLDEEADGRRNWHPLTRHLSTISELAVRADVSLPIGAGLALVLDGVVAPGDEQPMAFALDGGRLSVTRARIANDPQTNRSILLLPVLAARFFVLLDEGLVDVTCPPGATRSSIARATDAMPLRGSEGEVLLDLIAELALDVGARVPDWLPIPHALGWRGGDGGSIALIGAVAVEAGTALFLATEDREHDLANLVVRDVANPAQALFSAGTPIAAFHPDAERHPDRLHVVLLLPRRLAAGALHLSLAGTADEGGWVRTLDAAATRTQAILRAWLPPAPSEDVYLGAVAAAVRATVLRKPAIVAAEALGDAVRVADQAILLVAFDAEADAAERTLRSLPAALRRSIPVVIVLRSSDPGYDRTMDRLAATARTETIEIGTLVLAGCAGAADAVAAAFARLQARSLVVVDAGARFAETTGARSGLPPARSRGMRGMIVAGGSDEPAGAIVGRRLAEKCLAGIDRRLAGVPAVIAALARIAAEHGDDVTQRADFVLEPDPLRRDAFESRVDRALLTVSRPDAAHRGTA